MKKNRKGQSTLEYVIMVGILIGVFIAVGRLIQRPVHNMYGHLKSGVSD